MYNNYDYPAGADNENAPWNQHDIPEQDFEISICQVLSKDITVTTDNYIPEESIDPETNTKELYPDTSDTDWKEVYCEDHFTPLQLINLFKRYLENELSHKGAVSKAPSYLKHLISECSDWIDDELEIGEA